MGCRRCRGWEDSECCLSQQDACTCACHTSCECAFCHTIELKARSGIRSTSCYGRQQQQNQSIASSKLSALKLATVLRLDSRGNSSYDGSSTTNEQTGNDALHDLQQPNTSARKSSEKARKWASRRSTTLKPL
ncbi:hypothetical protein GGI26_006535, partial [Coemansia sp. RSA 1358]